MPRGLSGPRREGFEGPPGSGNQTLFCSVAYGWSQLYDNLIFFGVFLPLLKATGLNLWQEVECGILASSQGAPSTHRLSFMGFWISQACGGRRAGSPECGGLLWVLRLSVKSTPEHVCKGSFSVTKTMVAEGSAGCVRFISFQILLR